MGFKHDRLIDVAAKGGLLGPDGYRGSEEQWEELMVRIGENLAETTCFDIGPSPDSYPTFEPCLSPPFKYYWLETDMDLGVFFTSYERGDKETMDYFPYLRDNSFLNTDKWKWMCKAYVFVKSPDGNQLVGPTYFYPGILNGLGMSVGEGFRMFKCYDSPGDEVNAAGQTNDDIMEWWFGWILYGHTLINCKNVKTVPVKSSRQQRRAWAREYDFPMKEYRRLVISPDAKKEIRSAQGGLWENRMHLVRGHMRDFRRKGLFGKYYGMFYCPPHVKGNPDKGQIIKDYEVKEGS